jgi:hypothetical protein
MAAVVDVEVVVDVDAVLSRGVGAGECTENGSGDFLQRCSMIFSQILLL